MRQILLVDDDPEITELIRAYISKIYPKTILFTATDSQSGLEILRHKTIDCILLDYELPDMNGITFLEVLIQKESTELIPIIMLTGQNNESVVVEAFKRGISDYISKNNLNSTNLQRVINYSYELVQEKRKHLKATIALEKSEKLFRDILDNANDLIQSVSPKGELLFANKAWYASLGYTESEILGQSIFKIIHPDYHAHCTESFKRLLSGEALEIIEVEFITKNGGSLVVEGNVNCLIENDEPVATRGIFRDITARKAVEKELLKERERLQVTLQSIGDAVITTDSDSRIEFMNPIAESLTGWLIDEARGQLIESIFKIYFEDTKVTVPNPVLECLKTQKIISIPRNTVLVSKSGNRYDIQDSAAPIKNNAGDLLGAVLVFQDVTESRVMEKEIYYQSQHDVLTGLLNRREFELRLEDSIHSAKSSNLQHVLCFLDLDNFKIVNDTAGHIAGDALLKQVSHLLGTRLRSRDTLARLGGDEFCILLENCPLDKAQEIAEEIIETVKSLRFTWEEKIYEIGVSVGIASINTETDDTTEILTQADVACFTAKDLGRNQVAVFKGDAEPSRRHRDMLRVASLHDALENNKFCLYAQAILPINNNDSPIYEILLRLRDESGELLLPGTFIPPAERYKLMAKIDRWVISTALKSYADEIGLDSNVKFSINLSGNSLTDKGLLDFIMQEFIVNKVPTNRVCFEITETAAISHLAQATDLITALKSQGCCVALDDFGSGLSSFSYLKQFPIDYLKMDGSFMRGLAYDQVDLAMVESINTIGHVMGIKTVAECVENDAVLDKLRALGVDYYQGYVHGKPQPLSVVAEIIRNDTNKRTHLKLV